MSADKPFSQSRKRSRRSREEDNDSQDDNDGSNFLGDDSAGGSTSSNAINIDPKLFHVSLPREHEAAFATAIFELGLKHSSPKVLFPLMPRGVPLSTEHIKSHLQKYRIHRPRSKEEFQAFYDSSIKDSFRSWDNRQGWETTIAGTMRGSFLAGSSQSFRSIAIDSSNKTCSDSDHSNEAMQQSHKQEQLREKLKQLHELQMALLESSSLLSEWSTMGKEVLDRNVDMRLEIKEALKSFDEHPLYRHQATNSSSSNPDAMPL